MNALIWFWTLTFPLQNKVSSLTEVHKKKNLCASNQMKAGSKMFPCSYLSLLHLWNWNWICAQFLLKFIHYDQQGGEQIYKLSRVQSHWHFLDITEMYTYTGLNPIIIINLSLNWDNDQSTSPRSGITTIICHLGSSGIPPSQNMRFQLWRSDKLCIF